MPNWAYTLNFYDRLIKGRRTTEAQTEQQAVKNVVFRIFRQSYPDLSPDQLAAKALPVASRIYQDKLYTVEDQQVVIPAHTDLPARPKVQLLPVPPLTDVQDDIKKIRRGLEPYPENPDEPQED